MTGRFNASQWQWIEEQAEHRDLTPPNFVRQIVQTVLVKQPDYVPRERKDILDLLC